MEDRSTRTPIQIDMNADGSFRTPPQAQFSANAFSAPGPLSATLLRWALIVAGVATVGAVAFFVLWLALVMVPIAIGAAAIAYGVLRYRMWKSGVSVKGFGRRG